MTVERGSQDPVRAERRRAPRLSRVRQWVARAVADVDVVHLDRGRRRRSGDEPRHRAIGGVGRIVLFDRRGVGLSDPSSPDSPPTLEQWAADALAVCDEVGFTSPVVLGMDPSGGLIALFLAATHPQRVGALVLFNTHARAGVADDYPRGCRPQCLRNASSAASRASCTATARLAPWPPSSHRTIRCGSGGSPIAGEGRAPQCCVG